MLTKNRVAPLAGQAGMHGDFLARMQHAHLFIHQYRDRLANQSPRHAIAVCLELDARIGMYAAHTFPNRLERGAPLQRSQRHRLLRSETLDRRIAGGAMNANVGHFAHPPCEVRVQGSQRVETVTGDGVALDILHAAFVLALGSCPVRGARLGHHVPIPAERMEAVVEPDLARLRVVESHQRLGVVDQKLSGASAEMTERALNAAPPRRLPLMAEHRDVRSTRIAERGYKQV